VVMLFTVQDDKESFQFVSQEIKKLPYQFKLVREFFNPVGTIEVVTIRDLDQAIDDCFIRAEGVASVFENLCPYFAVIWPASRALSAKIASEGNRFKGRNVLELGCGLALPSLVCEKLSARVTALDFHPDVESFILENSGRNGATLLKYEQLDWKSLSAIPGKPADGYDFIVGSDILYEKHQPKIVAQSVVSNLSDRGEFWLADPGRPYLQELVSELQNCGFEADTEVLKTPFEEKVLEIFLIKFSKR